MSHVASAQPSSSRSVSSGRRRGGEVEVVVAAGRASRRGPARRPAPARARRRRSARRARRSRARCRSSSAAARALHLAAWRGGDGGSGTGHHCRDSRWLASLDRGRRRPRPDAARARGPGCSRSCAALVAAGERGARVGGARRRRPDDPAQARRPGRGRPRRWRWSSGRSTRATIPDRQGRLTVRARSPTLATRPGRRSTSTCSSSQRARSPTAGRARARQSRPRVDAESATGSPTRHCTTRSPTSRPGQTAVRPSGAARRPRSRATPASTGSACTPSAPATRSGRDGRRRPGPHVPAAGARRHTADADRWHWSSFRCAHAVRRAPDGGSPTSTAWQHALATGRPARPTCSTWRTAGSRAADLAGRPRGARRRRRSPQGNPPRTWLTADAARPADGATGAQPSPSPSDRRRRRAGDGAPRTSTGRRAAARRLARREFAGRPREHAVLGLPYGDLDVARRRATDRPPLVRGGARRAPAPRRASASGPHARPSRRRPATSTPDGARRPADLESPCCSTDPWSRRDAATVSGAPPGRRRGRRRPPMRAVSGGPDPATALAALAVRQRILARRRCARCHRRRQPLWSAAPAELATRARRRQRRASSSGLDVPWLHLPRSTATAGPRRRRRRSTPARSPTRDAEAAARAADLVRRGATGLIRRRHDPAGRCSTDNDVGERSSTRGAAGTSSDPAPGTRRSAAAGSARRARAAWLDARAATDARRRRS